MPRRGVLTFRLMQVITGHGYFGTSVFRIRRQGRGNRSNEIPRTWLCGQLKVYTGFLDSRSLTLPSFPTLGWRGYSMIFPVPEKKEKKSAPQQSTDQPLFKNGTATIKNVVHTMYVYSVTTTDTSPRSAN